MSSCPMRVAHEGGGAGLQRSRRRWRHGQVNPGGLRPPRFARGAQPNKVWWLEMLLMGALLQYRHLDSTNRNAKGRVTKSSTGNAPTRKRPGTLGAP